MHAYATKTKSTADKSVRREEQQGYEPESSGIINLAGGGRSLTLPGTLHSRVQTQFGLNLGSINLKESSQVADMGAKAMTQGNIISFAPGAFDPYTVSGQAMIGHELHHITEQAKGLTSNIKGSNIHYDPSSESASDAAGSIFASGGMPNINEAGPVAVSGMPSVTPAAADTAPVQGFKGIFNSFFNLFRKNRQRSNTDVQESNTGVLNFDPPKDSNTDVQESNTGILNFDPPNNNEPVPVPEPVEPVSDQSDDNFFDIVINNNEVSNKPDIQEPEPVKVDQKKGNDQPKPNTVNESNREASPADKTDNEIYEMENHFIPSPSSGIFKKMIMEKDLSSRHLLDMLLDTDVLSMKFRKEYNMKRGMTKDEAVELNNRLSADNMLLMQINKVPQTGKFEQYFGSEGEHRDLFSAKKDGGIDEKINMTYHANAPNERYSELKTKRTVMEYTKFLRPNLYRFISQTNRSETLDDDEKGALISRKLKRAVILNVMKGRKDVKEAGYSRDVLKAMYEKLYEAKKAADGAFTKNTGLDYDENLFPKATNPKQENALKEIKTAMSNLMISGCGHSWIETNSYDKQNNHRVRFTMGFWPVEESANSPFDSTEGTIQNPDSNDDRVGSSQKNATIGKKEYLKALAFAKNFDKRFSLSGRGTNAANCTTFATGMAKTAGMNVNSSKFTLKGSIHSPDVAAKDRGMTKTSENEYKKKHKAYNEIELREGAEINDSKAGELLMNACQKTKKYKEAFSKLSEDMVVAGNIVLKDGLIGEFRTADPLKRTFLLNALQAFSANSELTDTLEIFSETVLSSVIPNLTSYKNLKSMIVRASKYKTDDYIDKAMYHRNQTPLTSAKALLPLLEKNKADVQVELFNNNFLDRKWVGREYTETVVHALLIALEIHMPKMHDLSSIFEHSVSDVQYIIKMLLGFSNKQLLMDEFNRVFLEMAEDGSVKNKTYNDMYFERS